MQKEVVEISVTVTIVGVGNQAATAAPNQCR